MSVPLESYLELSTAHITAATNEEAAAHLIRLPASASGLPRYPDGWPTVIATGYGFFIRIPAELDAEADMLAVPDDLRALLLHAHGLGARWLLLDSDGPVDENLPTYDW